MLIQDLLYRSAHLFPEVEAVYDGTRRRSYRQLAARAFALAAGLSERGVRKQDRVLIVAKNRVEYVESTFALAELGAVAVPVNWRLRAGEIAWIARDAGARACLADAASAQLLASARAECPAIERWIGFDGAADGWEAFADCLDGVPWSSRPADRDPDEVAVQMYTSGTTGLPKGAMLTHRNVRAMVASWLLDMPLHPREDRFLQVTPLFHVGAQLMAASCVAAGARLRLLPEFLPGDALSCLLHEGITHALFVPAMIQWLLGERGIEGRSFPDLRLLVYGAAPMPVPLLRRAMAVFECDFLQGYGLTETMGVLTTLRPEDHRFAQGSEPPRRLASAGREVLCCEVRVVDESGREVAPGAVGEIVARGENIGPGYWNRPEESAEALRGGWFHTGDLAEVDAEGYVYIVDRSKDMILVAGENVFPSEVERVLREHPAVAEAAVIGIPHEHWGEEVLALVCFAPGAAASERELIQHCRAKLARFKCPTHVEVRDELPRNAAGKLLKRELRAPYWQGRERRV